MTPLQICKWIASHSWIQRLLQILKYSASFMYKVVYSIVYFVRLCGLQIKFLWDTLNHFLLIKYIAR